VGPVGEPALGHSTEQRILRSTVAGYSIQLARLLVGFAAKVAIAGWSCRRGTVCMSSPCAS